MKIKCRYCNEERKYCYIDRHESTCQFNPSNKKECVNCNKIFYPKYTRDTQKTCSHSCANSYFRSGESNGNWKNDAYRTTCFLYHPKSCVVCSEDKIVDVHHLDGDNKNNKPENLIPMCPTHHKYWHSRYREYVEDIVMNYINEWKTDARKKVIR